MPIEEEEEEEIDEDASIDGLEDVEKFINEVTLLWTKTKSERFWRLQGNKNDKKFQKRDFVEGLENREIDGDLCNEEIPRGSGRAENENEVQLLWSCGTLGKRVSVRKNRRRVTKEVGKEVNPGRKMRSFHRKRGERRTSVTGAPEPNHDSSVSLRGTVRFLTGSDVVNNVVRCWKKPWKLRLERNRVFCELETMQNSCPGKGIVDTGCAKMMMGSDTFRQYLNLPSSKERASIERVQEKNRFRFGDNETRMSLWSAVTPMNVGGKCAVRKAAIVAGDAPFSISITIPAAKWGCSGFGAGTSDFQQVGSHVDFERICDWSLCDVSDFWMC